LQQISHMATFGQLSEISLRELGWTWAGWRTVIIGLAGLAALFVISVASQRIIGNPVGLPPRPLTRLDIALAATMMLVLNVAAEETMFRGYLQTDLTRRHGAWIGIGLTVLLFGLRHLPDDRGRGSAACSLR
jgi:membrane protease YdiL (CAAX protease family)